MRDLGLQRFALLASAVAGRLVEVGPVDPGEQPWTDGLTVFIDAHASVPDQLRCITVQAALIGAGSLDPEIVGALRTRSALAGRYLAVEGHRALAAHESVLPVAVRSLVDSTIAARSDSPAASLAIASSRDAIHDPPESFGTVRPRQVRTVDERPNDEAVQEQHVPRRREEVLRELDDLDEDDGPLSDLISSRIGAGGAIGRLLRGMLGQARSRGAGPPGADAPTHRTSRSTPLARRSALTTARASPLEQAGTVAASGTSYPEWDVFRRRYRPEWCTVVEVAPEGGNSRVAVVPDTHALRRPLARLGTALERRHRQLQGDDIDIDAAVESRVEVVAGSAPDEAVYIDTVRGRRDLSVVVLLDVSGSAGEPSTNGVPVHEHQRTAAANLTATLHELGDRVALYAFRSQGRSAVHVLPLKRFDDHLDVRVMQRLGGLAPGAYTRLGAAIRHGAWVLEDGGGTASRLLVVLSDGFAYDHGYEGGYAEADARRALAEARRRGTGCLCLSIGASTDAHALRRVFGTAAHATIARVDQLAGVVGPLFRAALRSAEAQRAVYQRRERVRELLQVERRTA